MTAEEVKAKCLAIAFDVGKHPDADGATSAAIADSIRVIQVEPDLRNLQILSLAAENRALREALTPSGETKMAYSGEFKFTRSWINDLGNDTVEKLTVPWTTIKDIMAAIRTRAAFSATEPKT